MLRRKNEMEEKIMALEKLLKALMDECSEMKELIEEIGMMLELSRE